MTDIKIVIGSNFGDEGKGLMTDYFCNQAFLSHKKCITVLSNGGAQRGHTVDTDDGKTHVFKHFGSGTFANSDTFFSRYYILNPMSYKKEYDELHLNLLPVRIFADYRCKWSTPYDMLVNQIIEQVRDNKKHGSCGVGIWETEVRYSATSNNYNLYQFNNLSYDKKVSYLETLRDTYYVNRFKDLGVSSIPSDWRDIYYSKILIQNFIEDVNFLCNTCANVSDIMLKYYDTVVFENGQGLLLDQSLTDFYGDNLTPSNTGSINAKTIIDDVFGNKCSTEVCYVSRTYMTRHGTGKFVTECDKSNLNADMIDTNNITNEFQGELRYGELVIPQLITRIDSDSKKFADAKISLALTHMNEVQIDYSKFNYNLYFSNTKTNSGIKKDT